MGSEAETVIKRIYVGKDGMVTLVCPKCGDLRRESVEQYRDQTHPLKVKCRCMNVYEVELEFRQAFRKETALNGKYFRISHPGECGRMIVTNLSLGGCGFELVKEDTLVAGEEIRVELALDVHGSSAIKKKAVVLHVTGRRVGCKFCDPGGTDPDIAFYLRKS